MISKQRRARSLTAILTTGAALAVVFPTSVHAQSADGETTPAGAPSRLHAQQIDAENIDRLRVGGVDAIGGLGDWALGNGVLCAIVSDPSHESGLSDRGGVLVDLGHCGRADDQWNVLRPMISMARDEIPHVDSIRADLRASTAQLHTRAVFGGVELRARYQLDLVRPERLAVQLRLERREPGAAARIVGLTALHGNGALSAFTASTSDPARSVGFAHPTMELDSPLLMVDAIVPADLQILVGGEVIEPRIAYGLHIESASRIAPDGSRSTLPVVALNGRHFSMLAIFSRDFWVGSSDSLGWLEVGQALFMDLGPGDAIEIEVALHVGRGADVAAITDLLLPAAATLRGRIADPRARIHLDRLPERGPRTGALDSAEAPGDVANEAAAFSEARPDAAGGFALRAPPGHYRVRITGVGAVPAPRSIEVGSEDLDIGLLPTTAPAQVSLPRGQPMRLVFLGVGDTPDPSFGNDGLGTRFGDRAVPMQAASNDLSLAGVSSDPESVLLDPGHYRVLATRGPEYELSRAEFSLASGETRKLELSPPAPALTTPGWISADLHLHAARSDDSALPVETRVRTLVAEDLEVAVSSDHDQISDFGPAILSLGLASRIKSIVGCEITSSALLPSVPYSSGHSNAFPLAMQPLEYRAGAPRGEGIRLREQIQNVRELGGERVFQLNHPRPSASESEPLHFFEHLGVAGEAFDPGLPLSDPPNRVLIERDPDTGARDLDFDAIEVLNGPSLARYRRTRADWISLLLQGKRATATANSDTHQLGEIAAVPRNYLRVESDDPSEVSTREIVAAVRGGRAFGTTGPILTAEISKNGYSAQIGELFPGAEGTLRVAVSAASWVPVEELRVYVNGDLVHTGPIARSDSFEAPLTFDSDSFVTVEVDGRAETDGDYARVLPGFVPFAYTNPIFVDADRDGVFSAPGLPPELPSTIRFAGD